MTNSSLSGRRVLVVEDEIMVAWLLEDMLTNLGCTVVGPAARIDQALALIDAEGFDAAVLDLNLNGTKSYPVADALAAHGVPFRLLVRLLARQSARRLPKLCDAAQAL
jgi:DNA-binding response OmpR family regulator